MIYIYDKITRQVLVGTDKESNLEILKSNWPDCLHAEVTGIIPRRTESGYWIINEQLELENII
jgi:hypothetical protein